MATNMTIHFNIWKINPSWDSQFIYLLIHMRPAHILENLTHNFGFYHFYKLIRLIT